MPRAAVVATRATPSRSVQDGSPAQGVATTPGFLQHTPTAVGKRPTEREPRVRGCGGRALLTYAGAISAAGLRPNSRAQFSGSRSSTLLAEYPPTLTSTSAK